VLKFGNITTVRNVEVLSDNCPVEVVYVVANTYRLRTQLMQLFPLLHSSVCRYKAASVWSKGGWLMCCFLSSHRQKT